MESFDMHEMRSRLSALPVLEAHYESLRAKICEAEKNVYELQNKYKAETQDVEKLMQESFSTAILRLIGKYEGKLTKETHEQLSAKAVYDEACSKLTELQAQRRELLERISDLKKEQQKFESELASRKNKILHNSENEAHLKYIEIDAEIHELMRENVETEEAIRAAKRVIATAEGALSSLDSARGWATYDVWGGSGIISHAAKYEHIDAAESHMNRLRSQLKTLEDELKDVKLQTSVSFQNINSSTRAVDFWFDNIFTDLNVRSIITENQEQLRLLCRKIQQIISILEENKKDINSNIKNQVARQEALLLE